MIKLIPDDNLLIIVQIIKKELSLRKNKNSITRRKNFIKTLKPCDFYSIDEARIAVLNTNSNNLLSLRNTKGSYIDRLRYFEYLMLQDWSHIYPRETEEGKYYVYVHVNPSSRVFVTSELYGGNYGGQPFYVGKGSGDRAYNLKRNQGHGKAIKQCISSGWCGDDIVKIVVSGLSENKALEIESKLIYFFGTVYEKEREGILYNLDIPKVPDFVGLMTKVINRKQVEGISPSEEVL